MKAAIIARKQNFTGKPLESRRFSFLKFRAGDGDRTRNFQLGNLTQAASIYNTCHASQVFVAKPKQFIAPALR